ncbi:recombinase family protein [Streptomyces sp. NPDC055681]
MNAPMEPSELLTPSPAILTDVRIEYARLSTGGRKLDRQVDALTAAGCRRIFADKKSSKNNLRAGFRSLHEALDTTTSGGRLIFHVFAALAEFIRALIVADTNEGLAAGRARGRTGGRPIVVNEDLIRAARDMLPDPANSVTTIAKILGDSVGTLFNHIPELKELRDSRVPRQLEGTSQPSPTAPCGGGGGTSSEPDFLFGA